MKPDNSWLYDDNGDFIPFPDLSCVICNRSPADGTFSQKSYISVPICLEGGCVEKEIARRERMEQYLLDKRVRGIVIPPAPMLDDKVESEFDALYDSKKKGEI